MYVCTAVRPAIAHRFLFVSFWFFLLFYFSCSVLLIVGPRSDLSCCFSWLVVPGYLGVGLVPAPVVSACWVLVVVDVVLLS